VYRWAAIPLVPDVPRLIELPDQERFSQTYLDNLAATLAGADANEQAFRALGIQQFEERSDYATIFKTLPTPAITGNFRSDTTFARQRLQGANVLEITDARLLGYVLSDKVALDDSTFRAVIGRGIDEDESDDSDHGFLRRLTLQDAVHEGLVFVADYTALGSAPTKAGRFVGGPVAVFVVARKTGALIPVAIQISQPADPKNLLTPLDGLSWEVAKLTVHNADALMHQLVRHLGQTHFALESFALATHNELAPNHPLHLLMKPHFEFIFAINELANRVLVNPGGQIDRIAPTPLLTSFQLGNGAVKDFQSRYPDFGFQADLKRRGVGTGSRLKEFPYRDDGSLVWQALRRYVDDYVRVYYRSHSDVRKDYELQNWLTRLRRPIAPGISTGGFGVQSLPEVLTDTSSLVLLLTDLIFRAGPHHTALTIPSLYEYQTFIPNVPGSLYRSPADFDVSSEVELIEFLPDVEQTLGQLRTLVQLGTKYDDKRFGDFGASSFSHHPAAIASADLRSRLRKVEKKILQRNRHRSTDYRVFLPDIMSNSTAY
jgi:arachidonate 15-lipoxygenase